jgi:hypothetical protein
VVETTTGDTSTTVTVGDYRDEVRNSLQRVGSVAGRTETATTTTGVVVTVWLVVVEVVVVVVELEEELLLVVAEAELSSALADAERSPRSAEAPRSPTLTSTLWEQTRQRPSRKRASEKANFIVSWWIKHWRD